MKDIPRFYRFEVLCYSWDLVDKFGFASLLNDPRYFCVAIVRSESYYKASWQVWNSFKLKHPGLKIRLHLKKIID